MVTTAKAILQKASLDRSYWGKKIIRAETSGHFSFEEKEKAGQWVTCACGKLDDRIPREENGAPKDSILKMLGHRFGEHVLEDQFLWAATTLIDINRREGEILNGME